MECSIVWRTMNSANSLSEAVNRGATRAGAPAAAADILTLYPRVRMEPSGEEATPEPELGHGELLDVQLSGHLYKV